MTLSKNILTGFVSLAFLFLLVFSVSFGTALTLSSPSADLTASTKKVTVNVNPEGVTQNVSFSIQSIVDNGKVITFKPITPLTGISTTTPVNIEIDQITGDFDFGRMSTILTATGSNSTSTLTATSSVTFIQGFCKDGAVFTPEFKLVLKDIDIENQDGDDDEWDLLDEIVIDVEVKNEGSEKVKDVFVELGFFDSSGDNVVSDFNFENTDEEEVDIGDIKDGKDEVATFRFRVPADFEDGNYELVIKAYSDDEGESNVCVDSSSKLSDDFFESISVNRIEDEGEFIAFDDIRINPSPATCGDSVTMDFTVYNVGDEDQEQVKVNLRNNDLGLDLSREIRNDFEEGDDQRMDFTFIIPDVKDGTYTLNLDANYDYRNGVYRESLDDADRILLTIVGCTLPPGTNPGTTSGRAAGITASLESDAVAGEQLIVRGTITNLLSNQADFIIDAKNYQSWASLNSISPRLINIAPGESRDVTLTFTVDDDVSGRQSFIIETLAGTQKDSREVEVNIETGNGSGFTLGNTTLAWIIGIINVILIVLIIIVAVRISRR